MEKEEMLKEVNEAHDKIITNIEILNDVGSALGAKCKFYTTHKQDNVTMNASGVDFCIQKSNIVISCERLEFEVDLSNVDFKEHSKRYYDILSERVNHDVAESAGMMKDSKSPF